MRLATSAVAIQRDAIIQTLFNSVYSFSRFRTNAAQAGTGGMALRHDD
jgi:hypothetical protein